TGCCRDVPGGGRRGLRAGRAQAGEAAVAGEVVAGLRVLDLVDAGGLLLGGDPQPEGRLDDVGEDERHDERVDHHGDRTDDLAPQLVDPAAVEQAGDGGGRARVGEQADEDGAHEATDQVDAHDVERVVVAEAELEAD